MTSITERADTLDAPATPDAPAAARTDAASPGSGQPRGDRTGAAGGGAATPARTGGNVLLGTVLIAMFMAVLDVAVVNVALPTIHTTLHASGASLQLAVSGYTIAYAMLIVTGARLGDLIGHGRMFRIGLAVFSLGSLACGLAPNAAALIGFRAFQGLGAAALVPQVLSLIQRNFSGAARLRATSLYTAVIAGGAAVGQVLGGLLVSADLFGSTWRPVFLINVPIGIVAYFVAARVLPKDRGEPGRGLDPVGVAVLTPTVLAFVLPLVLGHDEDWPLWGWVLLAASVLGVVAFVLVERRVERSGGVPVIPGRTLRLPQFSVSVLAMSVGMATMTGGFFVLTLHLQGALGFSALDAGLAGAPAAAAIFTVSMTWRRLPAAAHPWLVVGGFLTTAASAAWLAGVLHGGGTGGGARWVATALFGVGLGASYSPLLGRMLSRVPMSDAADASGVISTAAQLSQVVGIATFGTVFLDLAARPGALASARAATDTLVATAVCALIGAVLAVLLAAGPGARRPD